MVELLEAVEPRRRHPNLILHCGAHLASLQDVTAVKTPRSTPTWTPIPYGASRCGHAYSQNHEPHHRDTIALVDS